MKSKKEKNLYWHIAVRKYLALGNPDKDATPVDIHEDILRLIENEEYTRDCGIPVTTHSES